VIEFRPITENALDDNRIEWALIAETTPFMTAATGESRTGQTRNGFRGMLYGSTNSPSVVYDGAVGRLVVPARIDSFGDVLQCPNDRALNLVNFMLQAHRDDVQEFWQLCGRRAKERITEWGVQQVFLYQIGGSVPLLHMKIETGSKARDNVATSSYTYGQVEDGAQVIGAPVRRSGQSCAHFVHPDTADTSITNFWSDL